jgi:hypothetical protein
MRFQAGSAIGRLGGYARGLRLIRPPAVVPRPYRVPHAIEELRRPSTFLKVSTSQRWEAIGHYTRGPVANTMPRVTTTQARLHDPSEVAMRAESSHLR